MATFKDSEKAMAADGMPGPLPDKRLEADGRSAMSGSDVESGDTIRRGSTIVLQRRLQSRHLQMIAIGKRPYAPRSYLRRNVLTRGNRRHYWDGTFHRIGIGSFHRWPC